MPVLILEDIIIRKNDINHLGRMIMDMSIGTVPVTHTHRHNKPWHRDVTMH